MDGLCGLKIHRIIDSTDPMEARKGDIQVSREKKRLSQNIGIDANAFTAGSIHDNQIHQCIALQIEIESNALVTYLATAFILLFFGHCLLRNMHG